MTQVAVHDDKRVPTRRAQQRADTWERIYRAAIAEFQRVGFGSAQIPRIAQAAGVVRGTFYFHFPSKEHVLQELAYRTQSEAAAALSGLHGSDASLTDVLGRMVEAFDGIAARIGGESLLRDMLAMYVRPPLDGEAAEDSLLVFDELTRHLNAAMARGEIRSDIEAERLSSTVLTSLFGSLIARRTQLIDRREELGLLVDLLLRGMSPRPSSQS
jgi:AcrR family transcriptional regulator